MSLIHTCELNGAHAFDYLMELLRHAEELSEIRRSGCPGTTARRWRGSPRPRPRNMMDLPGRKGSTAAKGMKTRKWPTKRASDEIKSPNVFGQARNEGK